MEWDLEADELRVLGSLMEKAKTTPEQYPLSVNALMNACNQKSARDPVMNLTPGDVRAALGRLTQRGLARMAGGYGGRVSKYEHRLGPTDKSPLKVTDNQYALLCVLMLRGPQTPGELRSRTQRLAEFPDTEAVEATLDELKEHEAGPLIARLPREPGKRESRFMHLLGTEEPAEQPERTAAPEPRSRNQANSLEERVAALEKAVEDLRARISESSDH